MYTIVDRQRVQGRPAVAVAPFGDFAQQVADNSRGFQELQFVRGGGRRRSDRHQDLSFFRFGVPSATQEGRAQELSLRKSFPYLFWLHQLRSVREGY